MQVNYNPFLTTLLDFEARRSAINANPFPLVTPAQSVGQLSATVTPNSNPSFQHVLSATLGNVNQTLQQPDRLVQQALMGGKVDIHDVMLANSKAELTVNIASQTITKAVQAYDRILQIQI
jgi:flagellar hook-basal body complex protein FliE